MRNWTKTAGLIFLAAASVYSYRAIEAAAGSKASRPTVASADVAPPAAHPRTDTLIAAPAEGNTDVKLLDDTTDPFASGPTTAPSSTSSGTERATATGAATQPTADAAPTSQPSEGRSVSNSEV